MLQNNFQMPEQSIEQALMQKIIAVKSGFHKGLHRQVAFERVLRDYTTHLRAGNAITQEYIAKALTTLHHVLNQPDVVAPHVLVSYITEILRFVGDVGLGFEFAEQFVDRIIQVYQKTGYPLTELYLVKAQYLPIHGIEHIQREKAFLEARMYAENIDDQDALVRVLLELAEYYTVISQYTKSIKACKECEQVIQLNSTSQKHYPLVLIDLGMNYFPLYDFDRARDCFLRAKALLLSGQTRYTERSDQYFAYRMLSNALHYLGRDAHMHGNVRTAMQYYVQAYQCQLLSLGDAGAIAFHHLRIGELLLQASLLDHARDHFHVCQETIHTTIVAGTAHTQLQLAWATLYDREGNYEKARESIKGALAEATQQNTSRMELRCLLKLLYLELSHFHITCTLDAIFQIMKTWRHGELRKGGTFRFFRLLRSFKQLQRSLHMPIKGTSSEQSLLHCMCSMHAPPDYTPVPPQFGGEVSEL